jgi:hypothetical protein
MPAPHQEEEPESKPESKPSSGRLRRRMSGQHRAEEHHSIEDQESESNHPPRRMMRGVSAGQGEEPEEKPKSRRLFRAMSLGGKGSSSGGKKDRSEPDGSSHEEIDERGQSDDKKKGDGRKISRFMSWRK